MSIVLSAITGQTAKSSVTIGDAEVGFTYKPYALTVGMSMTLSESSDEMLGVLAEILESWEVVMTEGEPFPPTVENIKLVPMELANLIATEILAGTQEGSVGEAEGSFGGG